MNIPADPKQSYTRKVVRSTTTAIIIAMVLFFALTITVCRICGIGTDYQHVDLAKDSQHVSYVVRKNDGTLEHYTMPYFRPIEQGEQLTVIIKQLPHTQSFEHAALIFTLYYCNVQIYSGNTLVYSQDDAAPFGFTGHVNYMVALPSSYRYEEIRIYATVTDNSVLTDINSLQLVPDVKGVYMFQAGRTPSFLIMLSLLMLSGYAFCYSLVNAVQKKKITDLFYMSLFSLAIIIWYMGYANLLVSFIDKASVTAYAEFIALFAAPAPLAAYMSRLLEMKPWHRICQILAVFFLADFVVMTFCTFSRTSIDYMDFIGIHRVLFLFSIIFYIIGLIVAQRKNETYTGKVLFIGLGIASIFALLEGGRFYLSQMLVHRFDFLHISMAPLAIACMVLTLLLHYGIRISEDSLLKMEQANLKKLAYIDQLTGVPNRSACYRSMEELRRSGKHGYTIIFIDINFLKATNDTWGHDSGDELIVTTAAVLRKYFVGDDFFGRWGGDEFVACHMGTVAEAYDIMKEVEKETEKINKEGRFRYLISLSWGCASSTESHPLSPEEAIRLADESMYQMKAEKHMSRNEGSFRAAVNPEYNGPDA